MSNKEFERQVIKEQLIIAFVGLGIFIAAVLYGFMLILDHFGLR